VDQAIGGGAEGGQSVVHEYNYIIGTLRNLERLYGRKRSLLDS
jgi:hypothetical protein